MTDKIISARVSGRMHTAGIKVPAGDDVRLEPSGYDARRGRFTFRYPR